jgi:serine/threonine protein kinase
VTGGTDKQVNVASSQVAHDLSLIVPSKQKRGGSHEEQTRDRM